MSVVACTDLSGKELNRHLNVGTVVISVGLGGVVVSTLAWNAKDACSIPALAAILPIFHHTREQHVHLFYTHMKQARKDAHPVCM